MLDFRNHDSYVSLAGILLGAALPELTSTLVVLLGRAESYKTTMWILSFYSATMLLIYMISQFLVLDFVASPYKVPEHFLGIMLMANYGFNLLVSVGISILFAYRIALFHGKRSAIALVFYGFCGLVICGKAIANAIGFKIGIDTYNLVYGLDYRSNPLYNLVPIGMSVAMSVEAVYSTVGSLVFLSFVTGKSNLKELGKADSAVIRRESFRIKLIALTNFLNLLLAVWVAFDDNFISHVAYYFPTLVYAIEIYSFVNLSYNSARRILVEAHALTLSYNADLKCGVEDIYDDYSYPRHERTHKMDEYHAKIDIRGEKLQQPQAAAINDDDFASKNFYSQYYAPDDFLNLVLPQNETNERTRNSGNNFTKDVKIELRSPRFTQQRLDSSRPQALVERNRENYKAKYHSDEQYPTKRFGVLGGTSDSQQGRKGSSASSSGIKIERARRTNYKVPNHEDYYSIISDPDARERPDSFSLREDLTNPRKGKSENGLSYDNSRIDRFDYMETLKEFKTGSINSRTKPVDSLIARRERYKPRTSSSRGSGEYNRTDTQIRSPRSSFERRGSKPE